jgi:hypothetical protein
MSGDLGAGCNARVEVAGVARGSRSRGAPRWVTMVRMPAITPRRAARLALALLALLPACESFERYARDRLLDATDVVDFKYGRAWGFGIKFEVSLYLGTGIGLGVVESSREWYGRHATDFKLNKDGGALDWLDGTFAQAGILGTDGGAPGNATQSAFTTIFFNVLLLSGDNSAPPMIERWRVGAEVVLPKVTGGMYLNFGELWDFLAGIGGGDPAGDDGVVKEAVKS